MRIPLVGVEVPGPASVVADVTAEVATLLQLVPRAAALLTAGEALLARADVAVTRVEAVLDRSEDAVLRVEEVTARADDVAGTAALVAEGSASVARQAATVADGADALSGRVDALLAGFEPSLRRLAPALDRFTRDLDGSEVAAGTGLLDRLPALLDSVDHDLLPLLRHLDEITPDVHALLEAVEDLRQVVAGLPGAKFLRRHGKDDADDERLDHQHR